MADIKQVADAADMIGERLCVHTMHRGLSRVESESPRSCGSVFKRW